MSVVTGNKEYFPGIGKIAYEGRESDNPLAFKWYACTRRSKQSALSTPRPGTDSNPLGFSTASNASSVYQIFILKKNAWPPKKPCGISRHAMLYTY